jgi:excisionase family DNA binding protein
MKTATPPGFLTTREAAKKLGVSKGRVVQLAEQLGAMKCGPMLLFPESAVRARKASRPTAGRPKSHV